MKKVKGEAVIRSTKIIQENAAIEVKLQSVASLKVKYYLMDTEILFTRSPFLKDEAKQFSYVQPFQV